MSAVEGARITGVSPRHVRRLVALSRDEWLAEQAARRERVRVYHDDEGHSWPETAAHFGVHYDTVKRLGQRARKERAAEAAARQQQHDEADT